MESIFIFSGKLREYYKYGLVLRMQEFDEEGNLIRGKKELSEKEKIRHEKNLAYYEGREEKKR